MKINIEVGDVRAVAADVLISTANRWWHLSGGVKGAILSTAGPTIQDKLHEHLKSQGLAAVPAAETLVQSTIETVLSART